MRNFWYIKDYFVNHNMLNNMISEYAEQTRKDQELHDQIAAERAENRYIKHYNMCNEVVNQICDFSCKVAEYRELTNK
jgi:hypothetical protein